MFSFIRFFAPLALLIAAGSPAPDNAPITRDFFALDMNKASHVGGQQSPWPDRCCRGEQTPVLFHAWRSLGAQVNWFQIASGTCPPRNGADPKDPCYQWARLDGYLKQAAENGEETIYTVFDTPGFANRNSGTEYPPTDVNSSDQYLKDFVTALFRHSSAAGFHIKYWECWNEPDVRGEYKGTLEELQRMCKDIKETIAPLDPQAKFVSPGFTSLSILGFRDEIDAEHCSGSDCSQMQRYLAAGGGNYADIIGYHGYAFPDPVDPLFDKKLAKGMIRVNVPNLTRHVATIAARTGNGSKPLWMTEGGDDLPPTSQEALANDDRHAAFVARYLLEFMGRGTSLITWYGWDFGGPNALLTGHTGEPGDRLNEGGKAFRQVYDWTAGRKATMTKPCTPDGTVFTCTLTDGEGHTMLAMYNTAKDCNGSSCETAPHSVPDSYTRWTDLEGGVHKVEGHSVALGRKPILLEAR